MDKHSVDMFYDVYILGERGDSYKFFGIRELEFIFFFKLDGGGLIRRLAQWWFCVVWIKLKNYMSNWFFMGRIFVSECCEGVDQQQPVIQLVYDVFVRFGYYWEPGSRSII